MDTFYSLSPEAQAEVLARVARQQERLRATVTPAQRATYKAEMEQAELELCWEAFVEEQYDEQSIDLNNPDTYARWVAFRRDFRLLPTDQLLHPVIQNPKGIHEFKPEATDEQG